MESQAIVNTMEVLETRPISDLVTEAIIKVCYVSEIPNPNMTVINKEVGREIAATLPGAPVAGLFDSSTGDFVEHSRKVVIENGKVEIKDLTRPYGFVSLDNPWYQDFIEDGEVRTYLMCKAYLWTRQYAEASLAIGKGQSMELDENRMSGYYEGDVFIFTDATLKQLCILGDAYEPCFSGAKIMTTYAKQYEDLAAQVEKIIGRKYYVMDGQLVSKAEEVVEAEQVTTEFTAEAATVVEPEAAPATVEETPVVEEPAPVVEGTAEVASESGTATEFTVQEEPVAQEGSTVEPVIEYSSTEEAAPVIEVTEEPQSVEEPAVDYAAKYQEAVEELAAKDKVIADLGAQIAKYKAAESNALEAKKNELLGTYSALLAEEDIEPIKGNMVEYSLDELEAKLATTYARKLLAKPAKPVAEYQVNISAEAAEVENIPEFLKVAMEYDKQRGIAL